MPARFGVVLLAIAIAVPAAAAGPSAKVEGAGQPRMLQTGEGATPVWVLRPGGAATLILHGPARVTVSVRVAGRRGALVRALVSDGHHHRRLEPPRDRDHAASLSGFAFVGAAATTTIRLGRGRRWITVAWPHHARAEGLLTFEGVDLGIHPQPKPIPLAGLVPPTAPKAGPKTAPSPPTPPVPTAAPAPKPASRATAAAMPAPKMIPAATKPAPAVAANAHGSATGGTSSGYEHIQAYGDRTSAPAPATPSVAAPASQKQSLSVTPWVGAYIPLYKLAVGPAAGVTVSLDLKQALGLDVGSTRLHLRFDIGWSRVVESGPSLVPGRGLDVGFTQDSHLVPASLALAWHLAPSASVRPFLLAGIGTVWTETHFIAFSAPQMDRAFGLLGVFGGGLAFAAGPGDLGIEALFDVAGVDLGKLGTVGETTLTGVRVDARYAIRF